MLFRSFSHTPFQPSNTIISLIPFFVFLLAALRTTCPHSPWYLFVLPFFLFYRRFSCSQLWAVIWFSFNFVQDFLLVSLPLSFFFPLFFFFSCLLSSTYDLTWIFVAFLTAIGVVSLKSDFASQNQNFNFIIRYLIIAHPRCFIVVFLFFTLYSFLHLFTFCFALIFLAWQFYTRTCHKGVDHVVANRSQ